MNFLKSGMFPNDDQIARDARRLARRDEALARALDAIGAPHVRRRPGGFAGLLRIIVEQQVSVPSAQALLARLEAAHPEPRPEVFRDLPDAEYRAIGFSRPKIRYARALAAAALDGAICFETIATLPDEEARAALTALLGVGPWSAAIYLLFCEGRMDLWPPGDVALMQAYRAAAGLDARPTAAVLDAIAEGWAPYRGVGAHILWTYYAKLRGRAPI